MNKAVKIAGILMMVFSVVLIGRENTSGAWFVTTETTETLTNNSATVLFVASGSLNTFTALSPYTPGEELVNQSIRIVNLSTIPIDIRFKLTYQIVLEEPIPSHCAIMSGDFIPTCIYLPGDLYFSATISPPWEPILPGEGESGELYHYYYLNAVEPSETPISIITNMHYDATVIPNPNQNQTLKITVVVQAKQQHFVEWEDIGTFSP
jgi:hypothetical protein